MKPGHYIGCDGKTRYANSIFGTNHYVTPMHPDFPAALEALQRLAEEEEVKMYVKFQWPGQPYAEYRIHRNGECPEHKERGSKEWQSAWDEAPWVDAFRAGLKAARDEA